MDVNYYFTLLKEGKQELTEYEEILTEIEKLKRKAKKNTL